MKLVNYFGKEFERENPLTQKDLEFKKSQMEIYICMNSKDFINEMLEELTLEEAQLIGKSAHNQYVVDRVKYGY